MTINYNKEEVKQLYKHAGIYPVVNKDTELIDSIVKEEDKKAGFEGVFVEKVFKDPDDADEIRRWKERHYPDDSLISDSKEGQVKQVNVYFRAGDFTGQTTIDRTVLNSIINKSTFNGDELDSVKESLTKEGYKLNLIKEGKQAQEDS
ncbi:unnamed protein product, partial [marine sediment metagenome]